MSLNSPDAYLNINNANLRVYGNVHTNQVHLGNMTVRPSYGLSTVTDVSNTTPDIIQFTNTDTAFTTTGNVTVGKELTVTGNVEVGTANLFVDTQNGRVGVGTTEPSGQLELVGDSTTQEYPPRALTGYETLVEGHGVFGLYHTPGSGASGAVVNAFNKSTAVGDSWYSSVQVWTPGGQNVAGPFNYTGTHSIAGISGEWVYITLPYHANMEYLQITARNGDAANAPNSATIIGSSDGGTTWEQVGSWSDKTSANFWLDGGVPSPNFTITSTKPLNAVGFVVTEANGWYAFTIGEIKFFGTPGPTTLDKGSLTLGRSLDVPRVSRYDVDTETPRPEKLVVDFDTTVNSSPTDISGKGNHGTFNGGASYSAADKAFVFDGTDDYIDIPSVSGVGTGAWVHSKSFWFKLHSSTDAGVLFLLGRNGSTKQIAVQSNGSGQFQYYIYGCNSRVQVNGSDWFPDVNRWYHCVTVFKNNETTATDGVITGREMYIDGVKQTLIAINTQVALDLDSSEVRFGNQFNTVYLDYELSNPKLYSVALEASEVQKLYRLGRTGRSMVISDTAVGIGKVPEAQLDVRGSARFVGGVMVGHTISDARNPMYGIQINQNPIHDNVFDYRDIPLVVHYNTTVTSNTTLNDNKPVLMLTREGTSGLAYAAGAHFGLSRYENSSVNSRSRLDLHLTHGHFAATITRVMSWRSNGSVYLSSDAAVSSDDRIKFNETDIPDSLDLIDKLKPQKYEKLLFAPSETGDWIPSDEEWEDLKNDDGYVWKNEYGFIAQDVKNIPELSFLVEGEEYENENQSPLGLKYQGLFVVAIGAIKELKAKNEALETQVSDLLARVTALENA